MYESFAQDHPLLFNDWKKLHDEEAALRAAPAPVEAEAPIEKSALREWIENIAEKEAEAFKQLKLKFEEKTDAL